MSSKQSCPLDLSQVEIPLFDCIFDENGDPPTDEKYDEYVEKFAEYMRVPVKVLDREMRKRDRSNDYGSRIDIAPEFFIWLGELVVDEPDEGDFESPSEEEDNVSDHDEEKKEPSVIVHPKAKDDTETKTSNENDKVSSEKPSKKKVTIKIKGQPDSASKKNTEDTPADRAEKETEQLLDFAFADTAAKNIDMGRTKTGRRLIAQFKINVNGKHRGYMFTDFQMRDEEFYQAFYERNNVTYLVYGEEKTSSGRPHLQGFVYFSAQRYWKCVIELLGCHCEIMGSNPKASMEYCKKGPLMTHKMWMMEGIDHELYGQEYSGIEWGECPQQGKRTDLDTLKKKIDSHEITNELQLAAENFQLYCQYKKTLVHYMALNAPKRDFKTEVIIAWGDSMTGKSTFCEEMGATNIKVSGDRDSPFVHNYEGKSPEIVAIQEFKWSNVSPEWFLDITDKFECVVNVKHGSVNWNPKVLILTSNQNPSFWWNGMSDACRRRISKSIKFFRKDIPDDFYPPCQRATMKDGKLVFVTIDKDDPEYDFYEERKESLRQQRMGKPYQGPPPPKENKEGPPSKEEWKEFKEETKSLAELMAEIKLKPLASAVSVHEKSKPKVKTNVPIVLKSKPISIPRSKGNGKVPTPWTDELLAKILQSREITGWFDDANKFHGISNIYLPHGRKITFQVEGPRDKPTPEEIAYIRKEVEYDNSKT